MKTKHIFFIAVGLLFYSCKKSTIEIIPEENSPVFKAEGTLGNESLVFAAGEDDVKMSYGSSSYNGAAFAFGELSNTTNSFKLSVFNTSVSLENYENFIEVGDDISFANKFTQNLAELRKDNFSNVSLISSIDWYLNGVYAGADNVIISDPGVYEVCGNFTFTNGNSKSLCNTLTLGFKQDLDFSIRHFLTESGDVKLWLEGNTADFEDVKWYINDSLVANTPTFSDHINMEQVEISAEVQKIGGTILRKKIVIDATFSGNFIEDFDNCKLANTEPLWDSKAILEIIKDNQKYSTAEIANYNNKMQVKEISTFEDPLTKEKLLKIAVSMQDVKLKSVTNGNIVQASVSAVFAFPFE